MTKITFDIGNSFFGDTSHFLYNLVGVSKLVSILIVNAIVIAGIILLFLLIFGGISMIAGAGTSNPQKTAQGKQVVTAAVIGFIIIVVAYWIVLIIGNATGLNLLR